MATLPLWANDGSCAGVEMALPKIRVINALYGGHR
jgi:hypothetical protein